MSADINPGCSETGHYFGLSELDGCPYSSLVNHTAEPYQGQKKRPAAWAVKFESA